MYVMFLALFLVAGNMAEGGHRPAPKKYKFVHVRDHQYGVTVVENPARSSLKRSAERSAELPRSSPRLNGLPDDVEHDMYCLSAGYFINSDENRIKSPEKKSVKSCSKANDMEKRLKLFGMPASFPSVVEALKYKAVFKDVVESSKDISCEELPDWIREKKTADEQCAEKEKCEAQRDLRTRRGCLGLLLMTN